MVLKESSLFQSECWWKNDTLRAFTYTFNIILSFIKRAANIDEHLGVNVSDRDFNLSISMKKVTDKKKVPLFYYHSSTDTVTFLSRVDGPITLYHSACTTTPTSTTLIMPVETVTPTVSAITGDVTTSH